MGIKNEPYRQPGDAEIIEIIKKMRNFEYTEDEDCEMMQIISRTYPDISDIMYYSPVRLTPEEIIIEAKKRKPILLSFTR